ncbi:ActS/PrrB/RegB family redox-sensitive histidine kinase [Aliigemmobacter aestuarii]|uniref:histidine kinase n=1 Tax=Aliigemmobacter aestuarii TaxID=1445661 RepID=A0A4S3MSV6_9RHOB|nr:ActS/PrrB/RegB family redox-sensitive histidine kinase [Gemmobacter aestuarii]THD85676.1 ActS/PrrB/RegB family redox-sensitive histidine kinase [Gemmobacter aestuarii]
MTPPLAGINVRTDTRESMRLRTLILLRWMAIAGQLAAIAVSIRYFDMQVPLGLCFMTIGASIISNLIFIFIFPENKRLSDTEALMILLFDLAQLCLLLFLTGGMDNPFALLVLAPVTISASALQVRQTVILGLAAIVLVTLTALLNIPMRLSDGSEFAVPPLFEFGFWLSIVIGVVFMSLYTQRVSSEIRTMSDALLATQMALAREQKLTDLGGVVAAAAHELGTPLATIKLVSSELIEELSDRPALQDDARLIRDQADRCRDIMRSMGRAGKDDRQMHQAPLDAVLREASEPHLNRGKTVHFELVAEAEGGRQPTIRRSPEIIHGLRNLMQNAVDFAAGNVWVEGRWSDRRIVVRIVDDGDGYPPHLIGRIGDPFVRRRRSETDAARRPEYEGMGLGLFIAKTLLERTGAELSFANGSDPFLTPEERPERCGAIVEVIWPVDRILAPALDTPLGENAPIEG